VRYRDDRLAVVVLVLSLIAAADLAAALPQTGALTDAVVRDAVAAGLAGKTQEASCTSKVDPLGHYVQVTAIGPTGRIMRAARDAKSAGHRFTVADVTPELRAPLVVVSAVARVTEPTDPGPIRAFRRELPPVPPAPDRRPAYISGVRLAAQGPNAATLEPIPQPSFWPRHKGEFPMEAVIALGVPVEVRVLTPAGYQATSFDMPSRYTSCWLGAGELAKAQ
jgi:hypothetical protein